MTTLMEKEKAHKLIDRMPANATWDDLMYEIYVREVIERGLADSLAGKTKDVKEVRAKYGLPSRLRPLSFDIILPPSCLYPLPLRNASMRLQK